MAKEKTSISLEPVVKKMLGRIAVEENRTIPNSYENLIKQRFKELFGVIEYDKIMSE